ncbi:MAG: DEAD/DEAH box helicase [Deltaproteobacteria bacterium]|nr:DEAD/DEAH box helicase [Deltaproteobacteria bacterium]
MLILHAGFFANRLFLWGETPATQSPRSHGVRRGRPKAASPPPFPYDAGKDNLLGAIKEAGLACPDSAHNWQTAIAWLPTQKNQPWVSSPLISESPASSASAALSPWQVTALCLPAQAEVELLCACVGKELLAPGVIIGKDVAFWTVALRFAGSLTARQRFLPGLPDIGGTYYARWEPLLSGTDCGVAARLAALMPRVCRALTPDAASPPVRPTAEVLADFVGRLVDQLVRFPAPTDLEPAKIRRGRPARKISGFDSLHDQWLHALQAQDGLMSGDPGDLGQLRQQIQHWRRPVSVTATAPFRLCFRLEEPEESTPASPGEEHWFVRYLLQAAADPSLLIPVREAWNPKKHIATLLRPGEFHAKEYLLVSLGQSARLCPDIEAGLHTALPDGHSLNTRGAFAFLTEKAMLLEQAGFAVMLPAWWTGRGAKMRLSARGQVKSPKMTGGGGLNLDQLVQFDWRLALGDENLSLAELQELAKLKSPLVKVRGQWVQLNAEEIQAALDFWRKKAATGITAREALQMALGGVQTPADLHFAGLAAGGWVGDLLAQLQGQAAFAELPVPDDFCGILRPYQVRGYSWLNFLKQWGLGACLADDMGLGKTVQTLALIARERQANCQEPILLVCPTSVVGNWQKEAARFTPHLPVLVHHGATRAKSKTLARQVRKYAMVISSYALLHRDFELLKEIPWSGVILDEAQNIKNPETKQAKAARNLPAGYRLCLTGTPVENNVGDLWSIMEFLNSGFLGSQTEFKRRFFIPIQANRDPEATQALQRLTQPFILRRLKTDPQIIDDLPEKNEMKVFCNLTKEQASLYAAVVEEAGRTLDEADGIQRKGVILGVLSKLKQVCNHPAQFLADNSPVPGRSGKLARLTEMVEEILQVKDRALIFTQFGEMGKILQRHLQETFGREVLFLHGGTPKKQRDEMVERFQVDGSRLPLFILSLKAGGTGLNLTGANHVFHFDRWWNPAVENQATDRAYRIGQTKDVQVHKFLCVGTLEEKIDEMIERKKEVAEQVVGAGEGWLTELTTAELKDLMALRREALGD